jgi:hypothetical protein
MANLTIVIDDDTLKRARIKAIQEGTSVNEVCRQAIERFATVPAQGTEQAILAELYPFYLGEHRNRTCRRLHFLGSSRRSSRSCAPCPAVSARRSPANRCGRAGRRFTRT